MSWLSELEKVYDNLVNSKYDKPLPIYHWANNASVTIILDGNGHFIKAALIDKKAEDRITVMPCTESCANRTSGADAYPLCDKWEYVAEKTIKNELYKNILGAWASSHFSNPKIKAVYNYITSETIVSDFEKSGIKKDDIPDFIRWEVQFAGDVSPCLWKDEDTQNKWIQFYNSDEFDSYCKKYFSGKDVAKRIRKIDLNYVNGLFEKIAIYHPSKVRNAGSSAKIISANDTTNFTFRGRFLTDNEACQISSETTQKAHAALRYLIKRQGVSLGDGLSVVTWNQAGTVFPSITASSIELLPVVIAEEAKNENDSGEFDFGFEEPKSNTETSGIYSTAQEFAKAINNRLLGYYGDISNAQNIMIMAVKEATPGQGRVSVVLYRELLNTDLLKSLNDWYNALSWYVTYWTKAKDSKGKKLLPVHTVGTPSPKMIAECAYGDRVKPSLVEKTVQRLLSCILDTSVIPLDLEAQCVKSASNLLSIENYRRDIVLETACAVYKYNQKVCNREEYKLALEENRTSRDYLFGRLLAVEQQYETAALKKAEQERETNAVRYMQQFSIHPAKTWLMLYKDKLPAYRRHLDAGLVKWFENQIQDITALFEENEYMNDKPLSGEFLLGYQCQLKAFRKNKNTTENTEE